MSRFLKYGKRIIEKYEILRYNEIVTNAGIFLFQTRLAHWFSIVKNIDNMEIEIDFPLHTDYTVR